MVCSVGWSFSEDSIRGDDDFDTGELEARFCVPAAQKKRRIA